MSFKGTWQKVPNAFRSSLSSGSVKQETDGGGYIELFVGPEQIEDDGNPFEEGEEVEILVRRRR